MPGQLLSGEAFSAAVDTILPLNPAALLINCIPTTQIETALNDLRQWTDLPLGAYANMGSVDDETGWSPDADLTPAHYCHSAQRWLEQGARVIGSCCGSTPAHIQALRTLVDECEFA